MVRLWRPGRRSIAVGVIAALAVCAASIPLYRAVRRSAAPPPGVRNDPARLDSERVDRLRALGYLDFVPPRTDGEKEGVVTHLDAVYPGYNFFTAPFVCMAVLMDNAGRVVNFWREEKSCDRWANARILTSGDVLVIGRDPATHPGDDLDSRRFLMKVSWTGETLWKRSLPAHHDVEVLPSGDLLVLTTESRIIPAIDAKNPVHDNQITRLSPDGEVRDVLSLYDLFRSAPRLAPIQTVHPDDQNEIDLFHANSIERMRPPASAARPGDPLYADSNVLLTTRHQDIVAVVDWNARKLVWAWGQGVLSGPHNATLLPNGNFLIFDNGLKRGWSRVVEVDPAEKKIVWQYAAPKKEEFFTVARGSNQLLPNGHVLVAESDEGRAFEIDRSGTIVWEFLNPFKNAEGARATIVRMNRIERGTVEAVLRTRGEGREDPPRRIRTGRRE